MFERVHLSEKSFKLELKPPSSKKLSELEEWKPSSFLSKSTWFDIYSFYDGYKNNREDTFPSLSLFQRSST